MEKQQYSINLEDKKQRTRYDQAMPENIIDFFHLDNSTHAIYHLNDCTVFFIKESTNTPSKKYNPNINQLYAHVQIFHEDSLEKILKTKSMIKEKTGLQLETESE